MAYGKFIVLIDGSNFHHTLMDLQAHVDFKRLLHWFHTKGTLLRAYYFTALLEAGENTEWLVRLTDWLSFNGYRVLTKRAKASLHLATDGDGQSYQVRDVKGDMGMEMVVTAMNAASYCDTVILFSGNSDLTSLVNALQWKGCRVVVVGTERINDRSVGLDLRRLADEFIELEFLLPEIEMEAKRPEKAIIRNRWNR